jgi:hypothetical protein
VPPAAVAAEVAVAYVVDEDEDDVGAAELSAAFSSSFLSLDGADHDALDEVALQR